MLRFIVSFGSFFTMVFLAYQPLQELSGLILFSQNLNRWWHHRFLQREQRYTKVHFACLPAIFRGWPPLRVCAFLAGVCCNTAILSTGHRLAPWCFCITVMTTSNSTWVPQKETNSSDRSWLPFLT